MRISDSINTFLTAAIAVGCVYALWTWQFDESKNGDNSAYAESACVDEINASFAVNAVNVYAVEETARGFVVRASVMMSKGTNAKIYCVTNEFGRVEDVRVLER